MAEALNAMGNDRRSYAARPLPYGGTVPFGISMGEIPTDEGRLENARKYESRGALAGIRAVDGWEVVR